MLAILPSFSTFGFDRNQKRTCSPSKLVNHLLKYSKKQEFDIRLKYNCISFGINVRLKGWHLKFPCVSFRFASQFSFAVFFEYPLFPSAHAISKEMRSKTMSNDGIVETYPEEKKEESKEHEEEEEGDDDEDESKE